MVNSDTAMLIFGLVTIAFLAVLYFKAAGDPVGTNLRANTKPTISEFTRDKEGRITQILEK